MMIGKKIVESVRKVAMNPVVLAYDSFRVSCYATTTRTSCQHHHRPVSLSVFQFQNPNFLTGNTIFLKMQVIN